MLTTKRASRIKWVGAAAALVLMAAAGLWLATSNRPVSGPSAQAAASLTPQASTSTASATSGVPRQVSATPSSDPAQAQVPGHTPKRLPGKPFARSLENTDIDGQLRTDEQGNLVVDLGVKDFFDYFLSTVGEVTPEEAVAQMEALARQSLAPKALNQAMALLGQYLNYKEKAVELSRQPLSVPASQQTGNYQVAQLTQALDQLKQLRRETLSPDAVKAFYGLQEAYGDYTLQVLHIQQRQDLSDSDKKQLITAAREQLPPTLRNAEQGVQSREERTASIQHVVDTAASPEAAASKLRDMGVDDSQIASITDYMHTQQVFSHQYQAYAQERKQLDQASMAAVDRRQAQQALLARYFDNEQQRTWARLRDLNQDNAQL